MRNWPTWLGYKMEIEMDQFLRRRTVEKIIGFGKSWMYLAIAKKEFPKPLRIGASVVWRASDVVKWQAQKISENQKLKETL